MNKNLDHLVKKYRQGTLSLEEEYLLANQLSDSTDSESSGLLREDFERTESGEPENIANLLHRIHHQIHIDETKIRQTKIHKLKYIMYRVAAILLIPLLLTTAFYLFNDFSSRQQDANVEIIAPSGSRIQFELPDGTTGTLSSQSKIRYVSFFSKNRSVEIEGDVYFNVKKDQDHPFRIQANDDWIEVVGTRFSVSAYPQENTTELVLEEGKVLFKSPEMKKAVDVIPGQRIFERAGEINISNVETWKYTAWKDGRLVFRNDSMEELAYRLSKWYDVDVEVKGNFSDYSFRGVFEDDSLEEVLRLLKMTSPIDYKITKRSENPDGTYSRKKVILF